MLLGIKLDISDYDHNHRSTGQLALLIFGLVAWRLPEYVFYYFYFLFFIMKCSVEFECEFVSILINGMYTMK